MTNYYFNNKAENSFTEPIVNNSNNNYIRNMNLNMQYNNNFNNNLNNVNTNMYINNMNYTNKNTTYQGNINNRNQYQFNQYNQGSFSQKKNSFNQQTQVDDQSIIQSLKYVAEKYPQLINLNTNNIGMTNFVKAQVATRFYVIKSFTEEDIHKVISCI